MATHFISTPNLHQNLELNEEFVNVELKNGESRIVYLHNYSDIFPHPGLFEDIFIHLLKSNSHNEICDSFVEILRTNGTNPSQLQVLELAAGNGVTGECFRKAGFRTIIGLDILECARDAALRDRPSVYSDYIVENIDSPQLDERHPDWNQLFDVAIVVAAIGMGHLNANALRKAFSFLKPDGYFVFNIYSRLFNCEPKTEFDYLISELSDNNMICLRKEYRHRKSVDGSDVMYSIFVIKKIRVSPVNES
jgi:SAM-dependent methyltransferase